ncbi:MAG TPA: hypothetical protein VEX18_22005 [Polyangiaceae bacterium]|nr:hypothetical protein [Polyangiaceae bacterium]
MNIIGRDSAELEDRMKTETLDVLDPSQSQLRALAATLDRHVSELSNQDHASETTRSLKLAWLALSNALALGPEPTLRSCPHCSRRIPREATRCRYCMTQSAAAAAEPSP